MNSRFIKVDNHEGLHVVGPSFDKEDFLEAAVHKGVEKKNTPKK